MNTPVAAPRTFLPADFTLKVWSDIQPYFQALDERALDGDADLKQWLADRSELEAFYEENLAWRYIKMTTDTKSEARRDAYQFFVNEIQPLAAPFFDRFNRKLIEAPGISALEQDEDYAVFLRNTRMSISLFREENIPIDAEISSRAQEYSALVGKMSIEHDGKTYTLPQAGLLLEENDRGLREDVFNKIGQRRMEDAETVDDLMDDLIRLRQKVAENAGYENYRDYKFDALNRFDYAPEDCLQFHESIEKVIVPLVSKIHEARRTALDLPALKPYDLHVDYRSAQPLRPFDSSDTLIARGTEVMRRVHPFFGDCVKRMQTLGHLDLASRDGKAPGGYNYPLYESGYPFIFMNAAGTQNDLITFVHESGHAVHSVLTHDLPLTAFKSCPSEVAELASMSMELISMGHWDVFYPDADLFRRAQRDQLERAVGSLCWIATIDCFQHWMYTHPDHSRKERDAAWRSVYQRFHPDIDWAGLEAMRDKLWQKQLHLFEVPFYYIEYGMAQLGAIAVYRNYKMDPDRALKDYISALELGNTRSIPEVYETAGIRFAFDVDYLRELADFIGAELQRY